MYTSLYTSLYTSHVYATCMLTSRPVYVQWVCLVVRTVYESSEDRARQVAVAGRVGAGWGVEVIHLPRLCCGDYVFLRSGKVLGVGELKCRGVERLRYPTLILSKAKVEGLLELSGALGVGVVLLVQWVDGVFWRRVGAADVAGWVVSRGGRTDRGDPADMEDVYEIPVSGFRDASAPA